MNSLPFPGNGSILICASIVHLPNVHYNSCADNIKLYVFLRNSSPENSQFIIIPHFTMYSIQ